MARKGPVSVFGRDVDTREALEDNDAVRLFDSVWDNLLKEEVKNAPICSIDIVLERLFEKARSRVNKSAEHREFRVKSCLFIAQLPCYEECDELWLISSSNPDPRTLYIKFHTVPEREKFEKLAQRLGWDDQELGLQLVRDFMQKFDLQS
jgi:hypothetical protein